MRSLRPLALILVAVFALSACDASGGGWLVGRYGSKATLGFDGTCDFFQATGSLSYVDRSTSPRVSIVATSGECVGDPTTNTAYFVGDYQARPQGAGGQVSVAFTDTGTTGPSKGDWFSIQITGGAFDGYSHSGVLQGGNFTVNG